MGHSPREYKGLEASPQWGMLSIDAQCERPELTAPLNHHQDVTSHDIQQDW